MCYGFGISQDDNGDWTIDLYMNDQTSMGPTYANIPDQYGKSYTETSN